MSDCNDGVTLTSRARIAKLAFLPLGEKCGEGPGAARGDTMYVDYTGRLASSGKVFHTSKGEKPHEFVLGKGEVIRGWDEGLEGLKAGASGELRIPAAMGYGDAGAGDNGEIPPDSDLIFEVTICSIKTVAEKRQEALDSFAPAVHLAGAGSGKTKKKNSKKKKKKKR